MRVEVPRSTARDGGKYCLELLEDMSDLRDGLDFLSKALRDGDCDQHQMGIQALLRSLHRAADAAVDKSDFTVRQLAETAMDQAKYAEGVAP